MEVLALFFQTPFFDSRKAVLYASRIKLPVRVVDITASHLEVVKNPRHGYGENMNPCIDCHAHMIRTAGNLLDREGAAFVVTGEVLGQRPMSQNRRALEIVEKESGYPGLVLRPLSAKRLPPTVPETKGWVDREALKGFSGRSRKPQMALARELGIVDYPSPAGGCLLTEKVFSTRLRDLMEAGDLSIHQIESLKVGRHFRISPTAKVVIGRHKKDNQAIESLARDKDILLTTVNVPGPSALLSGEPGPDDVETAAQITAAYSDARSGKRAEVRVKGPEGEKVIVPDLRDKSDFRHLMI